ncbi:hypothetical protein B5K05_33780 [Rhizobium phaseoli]|nr:hypothetical protein B5K05_33780 [Rhizobium phaseoli]RDJ00907.1 hypothetical protein B5K04_31090 [Rhizobium phaseoli]
MRRTLILPKRWPIANAKRRSGLPGRHWRSTAPSIVRSARISAARLEAVPSAPRCIACQRRYERERGNRR